MSLSPREQLASATMTATHEVVLDLAKAKTALEALVNGMQDMSCLVMMDGRVIWGNATTAAWFGCEHDRLHEQHLSRVFSDEAWIDLQARFQAFPIEGDCKEEWQVQAKLNDREREILLGVQRFQTISTRRGVVLLLSGRDITEVLQEKAERVKMATELETAQLMQQAFFPADHIEGPKLEICSFYRPAEQCSGDWWGYFALGDDVDLVCIADVTGHGAASALVTAMTQATCMTFAKRMCKRKAGTPVHPSELMREINQIVCETFKGEFFMTFFALAFDHAKGIAKAANAAHNFPMLLPKDVRDNPPAFEPTVRFGKLPETLMAQGNPIGFHLGTRYEEKEFPFQGGDRFILYTDGIIECRNPAKRMYGLGNFRRSITRHMELKATAFRDALIGDAVGFYSGQALADDLTLVTVDVLRMPYSQPVDPKN